MNKEKRAQKIRELDGHTRIRNKNYEEKKWETKTTNGVSNKINWFYCHQLCIFSDFLANSCKVKKLEVLTNSLKNIKQKLP